MIVDLYYSESGQRIREVIFMQTAPVTLVVSALSTKENIRT